MNVKLTIEQIKYLVARLESDISLNTYEILNSLTEALELHQEAQELADGHNLSENQKQFVMDALQQELEIDFTYSGRGMYGKTCPSVTVERGESFSTSADFRQDSMGLDSVYYAQY